MASSAPQPEWHHIDADGRVLGRLAGEAAMLLLGKHRADFTRHQVAPVYVIVTNTDKVAVTGAKETAKQYTHYTGYRGGLRSRSLAEQRRLDSTRIIIEAVSGMLPKNSLRDIRLTHLRLYPGPDHPHQAQISKKPQA